MAKTIIMVDTDRNQVEKLADIEITDGDWEESCYRWTRSVQQAIG
jgi:hypothetical protein